MGSSCSRAPRVGADDAYRAPAIPEAPAKAPPSPPPPVASIGASPTAPTAAAPAILPVATPATPSHQKPPTAPSPKPPSHPSPKPPVKRTPSMQQRTPSMRRRAGTARSGDGNSTGQSESEYEAEEASLVPSELIGAAPGLYTLASGRWRVSRRGSVPRRVKDVRGIADLAQGLANGSFSIPRPAMEDGSFRSAGRSPHSSLRRPGGSGSQRRRNGSSKKNTMLKDLAAFAYVSGSEMENTGGETDVEYNAGGGATHGDGTEEEALAAAPGPAEGMAPLPRVRRRRRLAPPRPAPPRPACAAEELEVGEESRAAPLLAHDDRFCYIAETGAWRRLR
eukprot:tig00021038_g17519.t1